MKQLLRVTVLVCMVVIFLSAWSLPIVGASGIAARNGQASSRPVSRDAGDGSGAISPNIRRGMGGLSSVAAISANDAWAVGDGLGTMIEHWNGTKWSLVKSPSPGGSFNNLYGVAASSTNDVWAVGSYSNQGTDKPSETLIEHWNGSQWSVVSSPSPGAAINILMGVAVVSPTNIWAVGLYSPDGITILTLTEQWNGTQWSVVPSPSPSGYALLNGVSVVSASDMWAVGYSIGNNGQQTLIEQWNGNQWSIVSSPDSGTQNSSDLIGTTAISANNVWAVGYYSSNGGPAQTLIEQWNGSSWNTVPSPNPGSANNELFGVAAASASNVWAVGSQANGTSNGQTLIEHWNGTQWSVVPSPSVGKGFNQLYGVATISPSQAWAVGFAFTNHGEEQALTEQWNGSQWSVVKSPDRIGNGSLTGVAAISASDIWAVGSDAHGTLTEHWNGTKWSVVPSPNTGLGADQLNGVAAASTNDVWAVGEYQSNTGFETLIEHWNGTKWSIVKSANSGQFNDLAAVAVVSANDIWAVGNSNTQSQTLVEHWNGSSWSVVSSPNPGPILNSLNGVSAVSSGDVWAVGYSMNSGGIEQTLIEQWNGTQWSVVSSPSPGSSINVLTAVTTVSSSNVWAVGFRDINSANQGLIEHWNGAKWSVITSPQAGSTSFLYGVAASSANNMWAVGYSSSGTLTEQWNGTKWSIVTSPSPGTIGNALYAVTDVSAGDAWAVGGFSNNGYTGESLAEYWNGSTWSVIASPNV
ncbi:MAG TPA: hypothetical protein VFA09_04210 [Ktedonobacteraceae bacterium]|nr:hypothetical protein [Ktedonobacteraceae bacterium]HZU66460.1 hypothetical protein [Ktedonobacteraceae bacterium]